MARHTVLHAMVQVVKRHERACCVKGGGKCKSRSKLGRVIDPGFVADLQAPTCAR